MNTHKDMDKKKINELKKLRLFYSESEYSLVKFYEKPDFIIKNKKNSSIFGVEITQYYESNTSSRLKNIPNYFEKITNNKFIHKEDIGILEVVSDITKVDNKGNEISKPIPKGILNSVSQSPDRIAALKELVNSKNLKFKEYDKSLTEIDLIIYDRGDLIAGQEIQKNQILNYLYKQEKVNTLVSPFRNMILLIEESPEKIIKITLKSSLF